MIIDAHCHYFGEDAGLDFVKGLSFEEHIKEMEKAHIYKFVLFTLKGLFKNFQNSNDELAIVASKYSSIVIPFGTINPWYNEKALNEIDRCIDVLNFKGFKLHPWMTGFPINSNMMDPIIERISYYDVPVLIHSGTPPWSEPMQIGELSRRHPKVKIIMAHMGIIDLWKEAIDTAKRNKNIWLETSGTPSAAIKIAIKELGPERIIFGSDSPYGGKGGTLFQLNKIKDLHLPKDINDLILGKNLQFVLDL